MKFIKSISSLFPDPNAQAMQREERLTKAYQAVFRGNPGKECQELVLADLAYHSGFSMVTPAVASDAELRMNEGKRTLYARIHSYLVLSSDDVVAIENAAKREAATSQLL